MKTSELIGSELDWAVTKLEYPKLEYPDQLYDFALMHLEGDFHYSTSWAQGGPIIEREQIDLIFTSKSCAAYIKSNPANLMFGDGPTPLIAAMRVYVANKLGDEVEIPEGITK